MSLTDDLLIILTAYSGGYRLMRKRLRGIEISRPKRIDYQKLKEQTLRTTFSRLKKQGLAENRNGIWAITEK